MRYGFLAVAALMVTTVGLAEQSAQKPSQTATFVVIPQGCPGGLRAQHQPASGATVWTIAQEDTRDDPAQKVTGPGLHVQFFGVKDKVQRLELSVSYMPAGARVMPVNPGTASQSAKELKKTFILQQDPTRRVDADLLVGRAATITRVRLVSVTYADGGVWHASSEDQCSIAPSLYMPVQAKK